ncbi:MAG: hypothetical protein R3F19_19005 [Verrucomicrobiales bacterium]
MTSPFWIGWETMAPTSKIFLVILFFAIGLGLSYLYRGRWARRHLRLLREQDALKREWDALNFSKTAQTESPAYDDDDDTPSTPPTAEPEVETMPIPSEPLTSPSSEEVDQPVVTEPRSISAEAPTDTEPKATEPATKPIPGVDAPIPAPTIVIGAAGPPTLTESLPSGLSGPGGRSDLPEKMPLIGDLANDVVDDETEPDTESVSFEPLGAIAAATEATFGTIEAVGSPAAPATTSEDEETDEMDTGEALEDASANSIAENEFIPEVPGDSPAPEHPETAPLGKDSAVKAVKVKDSFVAPPQPEPLFSLTKLSSSNTPPSERTTRLIVNVPPNADPLHLLTGLNPAAANALITLGITQFEQLFSMDDIELAQLANKHSSLEPLRWREVREEVRIDARMRSNPLIPPSAATREKESAKPTPSTLAPAPSQAEPAKEAATPLTPEGSGDALTALDGIDALAARQLNEAGIRSYERVAKLKPTEFDDLARRFMGLKKFSWPFWQSKLTAQAASLAGITVVEAEDTSQSAATTSAVALAETKPTASPVREKIEQVREKVSETRDKVENIAREAKQVVAGGASQVKASLEDAKNLAAKSSKEGGSIAAKAGHAISGTATQVTDLIRSEFKGEEVVADLQLGVLYRKAPDEPDDLTRIDGIDSNAARALNSAGIFTFRQIAHLSDTAPAALESRSPALVGIDWGAAATSAKDLKGHPVKEAIAKAAEDIKEGATKLAHEVRESAGHLADTVADSEKRHAALEKGREGIKDATDRIKQVAERAEATARGAVNDLQERAAELKEEWRAEQAALPPAEKSTEPDDAEAALPTAHDSKKLSLATKARHLGDFVEARVYGDHAEAGEDSGFRYKAAPFDADNLTKLPGLEEGHASFLNAMGIYKIRQISKWTDTNIQTIAREEPLLKEHDLRLWRAEARVKSPRSGFRNAWNRISDTARSTVRFYLKDIPRGFEGEDVEMSPYGAVYTVRPAESDPLERITGISPELATQLNRIGVYRFKQIAGWGTLVRRNVAERLELPAVTQIDTWVEQAKRIID